MHTQKILAGNIGKSILLIEQYLSYLSTEECYDYPSLGQ